MLNNNLIEIQLSKPERLYEKCYIDFMDSKLLTGDEKILFLALKRFLDVKSNFGEVYPTIDTLSEMLSYSRKKIIRIIKSLIDKKIIVVKHRGLTKSNLYILNDTEQMWRCKNVGELVDVQMKDALTVEQHIEALKRLGYNVIVRKEKEPKIIGPTKEQLFQAPELNQNNNIFNSTINNQKSQERYTLEEVKQLYDYESMIIDNPYKIREIDSIINILHDSLNTTKENIRISGEDKPREVVIGRLTKLTCSEIMYVVEKYKSQIKHIKNPTSYMLTLLYKATEQMNLDILNQVQCDMYNYNGEIKLN